MGGPASRTRQSLGSYEDQCHAGRGHQLESDPTTPARAWARAARLRHIARQFPDDPGFQSAVREMAAEMDELAETMEAEARPEE
jgi:hypothetical protein